MTNSDLFLLSKLRFNSERWWSDLWKQWETNARKWLFASLHLDLTHFWGSSRESLSQGIYISSYVQRTGFCQDKRKILGTSMNFIFWLCRLPSAGFHTTVLLKKKKKVLWNFLCFCISFLFTVASEQEVVIPELLFSVPMIRALKVDFPFLFPVCWYSEHLFLRTGFVGFWSLAVHFGFSPVIPVLGLVVLVHQSNILGRFLMLILVVRPHVHYAHFWRLYMRQTAKSLIIRFTWSAALLPRQY